MTSDAAWHSALNGHGYEAKVTVTLYTRMQGGISQFTNPLQSNNSSCLAKRAAHLWCAHHELQRHDYL